MQKYRPYLVAAMVAILMTVFIAPEIHEGNAMSPEDNPMRRVAGLPGDTVILEDGTEVKVEMNQVFVSAENPEEAAYSGHSETGLIKSSIIKGKVILRIWPFDNIGGVK